jgi:hypothetical protein
MLLKYIYYGGNKSTCKYMALAGLDEMIEIVFHGFEDKVEFFGGR